MLHGRWALASWWSIRCWRCMSVRRKGQVALGPWPQAYMLDISVYGLHHRCVHRAQCAVVGPAATSLHVLPHAEPFDSSVQLLSCVAYTACCWGRGGAMNHQQLWHGCGCHNCIERQCRVVLHHVAHKVANMQCCRGHTCSCATTTSCTKPGLVWHVWRWLSRFHWLQKPSSQHCCVDRIG